MSANYLLLSFALRYPLLVILTITLGFSGAVFNGISTTLIVPLILGFLGQNNISVTGMPPLIKNLFNFLSIVSPEQELLSLTIVVIAGIILKNLCGYINVLVSSRLSQLLVNGMRKDGLRLLLDVDLDFYTKSKVGDIINQISNEVGRAAGAVRTVINIFTIAVTILVFVAILLSISWQLTIVSTCLLILVTLLNQTFIRKARNFGKILSDKSARYSTALLEILIGIRLIKGVANEDHEFQRLSTLIEDREVAEFRSQSYFAAIAPINEISGILAILGIVTIGRVFFVNQLDSLSTLLLTYLFILFRLLPFVGQLNSSRSGLANAIPSAEIIANFLSRENKPIMINGSHPYQKIQEGIRFRDLTFAYPNHDNLVLDHINLWIPKGTTLALVGASGAGKSTLADLIPRFYDPLSGAITLDGKDLREYDLRSLRRDLGIVSQDTFLFNDSVHNNIAYSREQATNHEVIEAAKRANAYEFIIQLPDGFDTQVGDRGVMLSGGQRQRLAIARALLRDPDILILDEATSALDTVSERLVQQALEELCRNRTTIVIAHRLSTIQKADQIAVMDKGRVVEVGNHEELLRLGGYYTQLYAMQFDQDAQAVIKTAVNDALEKISYEIRSRLTPMIGFLRLVVDDLIDSPAEREELIEESYDSALRILKTLEYLQASANKTSSDKPDKQEILKDISKDISKNISKDIRVDNTNQLYLQATLESDRQEDSAADNSTPPHRQETLENNPPVATVYSEPVELLSDHTSDPFGSAQGKSLNDRTSAPLSDHTSERLSDHLESSS
jgi:subfamily B ATP-binding cassette protein MsbA